MTIFSWLKRVFEKPDASSHSPNENVYDTLTPKIITDASVSEYFEALDFAFTKKDVKISQSPALTVRVKVQLYSLI